MRTVVIPMAGKGTRFAGYSETKVLVPVKPSNDPMFVHAVKNLGVSYDRLILVAQRAHRIDEYVVDATLNGCADVRVIELDAITGGPLDSVLRARPFLEEYSDSELLIANADQVMVWPGEWALQWLRNRGANGGAPTIEAHSERHAYARIDPAVRHRIVEVREKQRISDRATIGIYWFRSVAIFLAAADEMIKANDRAPNGEFYVGPVYNYCPGLILEYPLCEFWSLGEPANLHAYEHGDYQALRDD